MYQKTSGTVEGEVVNLATNQIIGTKEITVTVRHSDIDPDEAERIFSYGEETGNWGWKEKSWTIDPNELKKTMAAARYYYGWAPGSERIKVKANGQIVYTAFYAS
jgi:hypothetical protein